MDFFFWVIATEICTFDVMVLLRNTPLLPLETVTPRIMGYRWKLFSSVVGAHGTLVYLMPCSVDVVINIDMAGPLGAVVSLLPRG